MVNVIPYYNINNYILLPYKLLNVQIEKIAYDLFND